ncbi:MAG: sulfotransferase family protein [Elainellaceae cyanobacterium]
MSPAPSNPAPPRLLHPLMGADIQTLLQVLSANGGIPLRCWPHVSLAIATSLARLPVTAVERVRVAQLRRRHATHQSGQSPNQPPVFIVGHWRSGTTFLYELLCQSPQFAYVSPFAVGLPWEFLTLTELMRPVLERALPRDRFIDSMQVNSDSPQEDEIGLANMQPVSFYHGLYFPSRLREHFNAGIFFDDCSPEQIETWQRVTRLFFEKIQLEQPGKQLLIKNPVYTARVAMLRAMFPDAKFIHIYRNPYIVFQSTRNFYWKLFKELALQPFENAPVDDLILDSYPRMMDMVLKDSADLPAHQWVELRFEPFEADPISHLQHIYHALGIEGFDQAKPRFERYLDSKKQYRKNRYQFPEADNQRVTQKWRSLIEHWGYAPP